MRTKVIAEVGSTWEGQDVERGLAVIQAVAAAGADYVKFQWCSSPERLGLLRRAQDYVQHYQALAWPAQWHTRFAEEAHRLGIGYACTAYLEEDVPVVAEAVDLLKVASFEAMDPTLVRAAALQLKRLVVSTGMCSREDMRTIVKRVSVARGRFGDDDLVLLHCVSGYPTPRHDLNLAWIPWMRDAFPDAEVGFSDHSRDHVTAVYAVLAGARWLEVHVTDPLAPIEHPDRCVSLSLEGLAQYMASVQWAEEYLGEAERPIAAERKYLPYRRT